MEAIVKTSGRPYLDRACLAFASLDWIIFGSLHFAYHDATRAQIPGYVPFPDALVVLTGILEVGTGLMLLNASLRRWGALCSLALLILLLPAVVHMLASDAALPQLDSDSARAVVRTLLVPHNLLLALCSYHLWRYPTLSPLPERGPVARLQESIDFTSIQGATLLVAALLLASNCAGFLVVAVANIHNRSIACLWGMACIAAGALVGFLFAVPKVNPAFTQRGHLRTNNNIEEISDWLTKIIVGVGLVNLNEGVALLDRMSNKLAGVVSKDPAIGPPLASALIVYFLLVGFMQGYLLTRMFLVWQFSRMEGQHALEEAKQEPSPGGEDGAQAEASPGRTGKH
jgi:uncharacterized membrane protein